MANRLVPPTSLFLFRLAVFLAAAIGLNHLLELDIPLLPLFIGTFGGQVFALMCIKRRLSFLGFILAFALVWGLSEVGLKVAEYVLPFVTKDIFAVDTARDTVVLTLLFGVFNAIATWFLCRIPGVATLEAVTILSASTFFISDHRNFKLDSPKFVADIAWQFSIQPVSAYLILGGILSAIVAVYIWLAIQWSLQSTFKAARTKSFFSIRGVIASLFILALLGFGLTQLFQYYNRVQKNLVANGVGQENSPGLSPLGFNSALGSTNQPAAMVRLDGDYTNNPFSPMLYLRENALSDLQGTQLVVASVAYDTDLHRTSPSEPFIIDPPQVTDRKKLLLAAYLLTDHSLSFAIDFPISIQPLKNPKPDRFKGAFQATSLVPTFVPANIVNSRTTNPAWPKETLDHYLKTVADPRYQELALRITANAPTEIDKANAIAQYLSTHSIYTLTPNHSVAKDADQVAPYLFGDLRGYCVHFAHATVFMLRSLGIPSRIGTGYLTDLSRAKDGHILLRMSDRHAWAEVYVDPIGWVPFDTKPTQVESHGDSEIDMKLLEELMGMVGDDEVILPTDKELNEPGLKPEESTPWTLPTIPWISIFVSIVGLLFALKVFVRLSWMLPGTDARRIKRYYRSMSSVLIDLGYGRKFGETRSEYAERLSSLAAIRDLIPLIQKSFVAKYSIPSSTDVTEAKEAYNHVIRQLHDSTTSRMISYLNPTSSFLLIRNRW